MEKVIKGFSAPLAGIEPSRYIEPSQTRKNNIKKAIENCDANEYILTTDTIIDRIGADRFYSFFFLYLEARRHSNYFPDECYVKVKMLGNDTGFIELHASITGECLEWKYCEGISQTESVRP